MPLSSFTILLLLPQSQLFLAEKSQEVQDFSMAKDKKPESKVKHKPSCQFLDSIFFSQVKARELEEEETGINPKVLVFPTDGKRRPVEHPEVQEVEWERGR